LCWREDDYRDPPSISQIRPSHVGPGTRRVQPFGFANEAGQTVHLGAAPGFSGHSVVAACHDLEDSTQRRAPSRPRKRNRG
jgi:hypothetical protein